MKHISKALVAFSLLAAASALHAQTSYYGTNFDGSTTYPYNDATNYKTGAQDSGQSGFYELNTVGGWTASQGAVFTTTAFSGLGVQVYSGNPNASGSTVASHALTTPLPTTGIASQFYTFNTDFLISGNGPGAAATATGDTFAFNFTNSGGTVFSINFLPAAALQTGGSEGAPNLQIIGGGTTTSSGNGPDINGRYHLTIAVAAGSTVTATLTSGSGVSQSVKATVAGANAITGFGASETDAAGSGQYDYLLFDNVSVVVPEPSTYAMMGLGLVGMLGLMKFRRTKA